jgi:hypothetical protein
MFEGGGKGKRVTIVQLKLVCVIENAIAIDIKRIGFKEAEHGMEKHIYSHVGSENHKMKHNYKASEQ